MTKSSRILLLSTAMLVLGIAGPASTLAKGPPIKVEEAVPNFAIQADMGVPITLKGRNFPANADVFFILNKAGDDDDGSDIQVVVSESSTVTLNSAGDLVFEIDVAPGAILGDYDIEVIELSAGGRKGKGTTLFSVQSKSNDDNGALGNECAIEFEALFDFDVDDMAGDGVSNDLLGNYVAGTGSGPGFRLDTNGSIKLERNNDTRFINIDFNVAGVCDENGDFPTAAFCTLMKGVDLRFDRDIEPLNLCELDDNQTGLVSLKFTFEAEPGNTLRNTFRGRDNKDPTTLHLRYGCWPGAHDSAGYHPAEVTRLDEFTWYIEGKTACLHTNLGNSYLDSNGELGLLNMPFGLTITDINKPEEEGP